MDKFREYMKRISVSTDLSDKRKLLVLLAAALAVVIALLGCTVKERHAPAPPSPFEGREAADLYGYPSMLDYNGESRLMETSVAEVDQLMKDDKSFVLFIGYEECGYCSQLLPYLNDALTEAGTCAGYIDTRKDPEWMTNADIDDYDLFVKRFRRFLEKDEDGERYLYTPDLYVIKDGKVKAHHQGVLAGVEDPDSPLTSSQEDELHNLLMDMLAELE